MWTTRRIDQIGTISRGRSRHRPRDAAHLYGGPYPFVQTGDVKHAGLYLTEFTQTYSEAGLEQSRLWPEGTLCITIAANIADTSILTFPACFPDSVIGFIADPNLADVRFVKYLFDSSVQRRLRQFTQGAAQDNLSQEKLLSLDFQVPDLPTQRRIAEILSAYDDLIENNQRRMKLLEESARLLYEEWFVRLRFPGHEHTRIVDGVPEGWRKTSIGAVTTYLGRGISPSYDDAGKSIVINQKCIRDRRLDLGPARRQSKEFKPDRQIQVGDVLVNSTGEGTLGRVSQVFVPTPDCTVDSHVTIVRPDPGISLFVFGQMMMALDSVFPKMGRGATNQKELGRDQIGEMMFVLPTSNVSKAFDDFAAPLYSNVCRLMEQNQKLRAARDLLLPRLMNGEIEV